MLAFITFILGFVYMVYAFSKDWKHHIPDEEENDNDLLNN